MRQSRSILGGREYFVITGGALTSESVRKLIIDCFGGLFSEDYGATEVTILTESALSFSIILFMAAR